MPDITGEVVSRIADAERLAAAKSALGKLRRSEREVVTLRVRSGLSYAEAAEALPTDPGVLLKRLRRGGKSGDAQDDWSAFGEIGQLLDEQMAARSIRVAECPLDRVGLRHLPCRSTHRM
ncbi:sigma factor-like helix-turn-helix DNA-binding protein [Streptomyces olivoreticuli]